MGVGIPGQELTHLRDGFKLKWTDTALRYLGTYIPTSIALLFKLNFPPLLKNVQKLLDSWDGGLHSWFGRCNILKMTILPKFLYLLQALPIRVPGDYFKQVQTTFSRFLWAGNKQSLPPQRHRGV